MKVFFPACRLRLSVCGLLLLCQLVQTIAHAAPVTAATAVRKTGYLSVADGTRLKWTVLLPRESQSSYFVLGELSGIFERAGWKLEVHGWPSPLRERAMDLLEVLRHGRRTARFPIVLGTRHG